MKNAIYTQVIQILKKDISDKTFYREFDYNCPDQVNKEICINKSDDDWLRISLEKRYKASAYSLEISGSLGSFKIQELSESQRNELLYLFDIVKVKCDNKLLSNLQSF